MKKAFAILASMVCILMITTLVIDAPASQASEPPKPVYDGGVIRSPLDAGVPRLWTQDEMAAAQPYPMPEFNNAPQPAGPSPEMLEKFMNSTPEFLPATLPDGTNASALDASGLDVPLPRPSSGGYEYPGPFTRYFDKDNYSKVFPDKAIGKLFFWQGGGLYVCSAASIGPNAIWTAAHCLWSDKYGWSYNVVFVPGYLAGKKPHGQWPQVAGGLFILSDYAGSQNYGHDYGGVILQKVKRKTISQKVGTLGFAYNLPLPQHWFAVGYPQALPFTGSNQVVCAASYAYSDSYASFQPSPIAIGCDQTGGTSGGPWIIQYGSGNYLNGNMSYRYLDDNSQDRVELYSPYFDDAAYYLYTQLILY